MIKDEFKLIQSIQKKIPRLSSKTIGIGDDAAVIALPKNGKQVVTTDVLVDGVDFIKKRVRPEQIGRKALGVNLSDLAAMGAQGKSFVVTLGITKAETDSWVLKVYDGMLQLAKRYNLELIGGDLTASQQFFISLTLIGHLNSKPVLRSRARVGDWIGVTGELGGSILKHQFDFCPRMPEGYFLAERGYANSMIDISDGLLQDLDHILRASKVGAKLVLPMIPISKDAKKIGQQDYIKALKCALSDGEDFELLFTVAGSKKATLERVWNKKFPQTRLSWIGRIMKSKKTSVQFEGVGKDIFSRNGQKKGYSHFS